MKSLASVSLTKTSLAFALSASVLFSLAACNDSRTKPSAPTSAAATAEGGNKGTKEEQKNQNEITDTKLTADQLQSRLKLWIKRGSDTLPAIDKLLTTENSKKILSPVAEKLSVLAKLADDGKFSDDSFKKALEEIRNPLSALNDLALELSKTKNSRAPAIALRIWANQLLENRMDKAPAVKRSTQLYGVNLLAYEMDGFLTELIQSDTSYKDKAAEFSKLFESSRLVIEKAEGEASDEDLKKQLRDFLLALQEKYKDITGLLAPESRKMAASTIQYDFKKMLQMAEMSSELKFGEDNVKEAAPIKAP